MKKNSRQAWAEVVFGSSDSARSQAIRRALRAGILRKMGPRLYTSNLTDQPGVIVARHCYYILGQLYPGAVISHRSAFEGGVSSGGVIVLTYRYTKNLRLPGLQIRLIAGKGAQPGDTPFMEALFMASRARALLENLQPSRAKAGINKNLAHEQLEALLEKFCRVYGKEELHHLRDQAKKLAKSLNLNREFIKLEKLIGALSGNRTDVSLQTESARARAMGQPYDVERLELFTKLFSDLKNKILPIRRENIKSVRQLHHLAFFEAYFSNYIEGTEFSVDEAADIIFHHKLRRDRPEDAHDIVATYQIVANTTEMNRVPASGSQFLSILKKRHFILMETRMDKDPGHFKTMANRAGNTIFVAPELVEGTLVKSFSLYENLDPGIPRALFMMFIVSEIHPFLDGNGRIARIMMNAELVHAGECRVIIPTVYREDYLLALRKLSRDNEAESYIRMLIRAQEFTASIDFRQYDKAINELSASHAFLLPHEGKLVIRK